MRKKKKFKYCIIIVVVYLFSSFMIWLYNYYCAAASNTQLRALYINLEQYQKKYGKNPSSINDWIQYSPVVDRLLRHPIFKVENGDYIYEYNYYHTIQESEDKIVIYEKDAFHKYPHKYTAFYNIINMLSFNSFTKKVRLVLIGNCLTLYLTEDEFRKIDSQGYEK